MELIIAVKTTADEIPMSPMNQFGLHLSGKTGCLREFNAFWNYHDFYEGWALNYWISGILLEEANHKGKKTGFTILYYLLITSKLVYSFNNLIN